MSDEVFKLKSNWYYWDAEGLQNGPFNSEEQANKALEAYIEYDLNWVEDTPIRKMKPDMGL